MKTKANKILQAGICATRVGAAAARGGAKLAGEVARTVTKRVMANPATPNACPVASLAAKGNEFYRNYGKRALSVAISAGGLAVFALPMAVVAVAIKIDDPAGPVIFKQERLGKDGKVFNMYKFRSMCVGAESQGSGVYSGAGDSRVTRVGNILRKTSIDELPQLVNMLKGDMSLIGPRPPLTYHPWPLEQYTPQQRRMFEVRPGLTGWAQINGRRTVEWNQRIEYNVWYVDNLSLRLDAEIFFRTFAKIAKSEDNENTGATVNA